MSDQALAVLLTVLVYAGMCWWWPHTRCRKCKGGGKVMAPAGRHWRRCPRCAGSGEHLRLGARVLGRGRRE